MKKRPINDHLVTYYQSKQLSHTHREDLLDFIEKEQTATTTSPPTTDLWTTIRNYFSPGHFAYASIFLLLGYVAWMVNGLADHNTSPSDLTASISREIEMNHNKKFEVEFKEDSLPALAKLMDKLDFPLLIPDNLTASMRINGARYCSIKGRIAAQIQMIDSNGRYCTLYLTKLIEPLLHIKKSTINLDGVKLLLWQEKGVFFGFAQPDE